MEEIPLQSVYVVPGLSRALHLTAIPGLSLHTCGDKSIFSQRESQRLHIVLQSDTMYRRESGVTPTRHSGEHSSLFREHDNYFINFSNKFLNNPGSVRQLKRFSPAKTVLLLRVIRPNSSAEIWDIHDILQYTVGSTNFTHLIKTQTINSNDLLKVKTFSFEIPFSLHGFRC